MASMQPLGREVEQVELALRSGGSTARRFAASCVELRKAARTPTAASASTWSCMRAIRGEMTTPVPAHQRGNLVAQGLAAAGGHEHERVAAADHAFDDLGLRPRKAG